MKNIKLSLYIIVMIVVIGLGYKFYVWVITSKQQVSVVTTPRDTSFSQVTHNTYRPHSIPIIEKVQTPPAQLPTEIKPKDVKEVIVVTKKPNDTTKVIITKKGEVYVSKQGNKVENVTVTTYEPPILDFGLFLKVGIDFDDQHISPVIEVTPLEILGKIDIPVLSLDIEGIGAGFDYMVFNPISVGVMYHVDWRADKSIRLDLVWDF